MSAKTFVGQRRRAIGLLAGALVALVIPAVPCTAIAQSAFPSRPIRIVVPFGAGGIADLSARVIGEKLSSSLKTPVIIDNKPGAGGVVGAEIVAKAEPDGHTLLLMSNANAVSAGLFRKLPYDTIRDFAPVGMIGTFDLAIVTAANSPFRTLPELIAYAKANPDKLNLGTINIGSTQHLAAELFKTSAGVSLQVVPFNGTPAVVAALRGKQIDAAVEILGPILTQIQSGAVRALAVAGERRSTVLPSVPTVVESGVPGYVVTSWNALAAPAKTPTAVGERLSRELAGAVASPDVAARLRQLNIDPKAGGPAEVTRVLRSEMARWSGVIARAKIPRQ